MRSAIDVLYDLRFDIKLIKQNKKKDNIVIKPDDFIILINELIQLLSKGE